MRFVMQYTKPPFPTQDRWEDDLRHIAETGFDTIVASVLWSWVEPEAGKFEFDDLDRLVDLAAAHGLDVILCLFAEVQPVWIHREIPGSHMVDHRGQAVVSSQMSYFQFGIMPGGCVDHPDVRALATRFLTTTTQHFANASNLVAWDCWNEIRWMSQSDGYVCHCQHTTARFRDWLRGRFGTLEALNTAWHRRYRNWDDVAMMKVPPRTYTDVMAYEAFITERASSELRWRYDAVRAADATRPIYAHSAFPSIFCTGEYLEYEPALGRGNDWELSEQVDGFGSSHFPAWMQTDPADYGARLEASRSATAGKMHWIAELQGGAAGHGLSVMRPVLGDQQARWVWSGIARGAKAVSFWNWRDEVYGRESAGFGVVGDDGHRDDRMTELRLTASAFRRHNQLLDDYEPDAAKVGVVFEPFCYQLDWAAQGGGGLPGSEVDPFAAGHDVLGYVRALERTQIPYDIVEPRHCPDLSQYRLLIMPWALVVDGGFARRVADWVRAGGTLVVEPEFDAFDTNGLYRYAHERPSARFFGLQDVGRRPLDGRCIEWSIAGESGELQPASWLEPQTDGSLFNEFSLGEGRVVALGSYVGIAYWAERYPDFDKFVRTLASSAGALPDLRCDFDDGAVVQWRHGRSGERALLFVINEGAERTTSFRASAAALPYTSATNLLTGAALELKRVGDELVVDVDLDEGRYHLFAFDR